VLGYIEAVQAHSGATEDYSGAVEAYNTDVELAVMF
jgi:hypothetical protein